MPLYAPPMFARLRQPLGAGGNALRGAVLIVVVDDYVVVVVVVVVIARKN